jgi:hypothetical protein
MRADVAQVPVHLLRGKTGDSQGLGFYLVLWQTEREPSY